MAPGSARMIKLSVGHTKLFISVIRFHLGGYFFIGDFFRTKELFERLKARQEGRPWEPSQGSFLSRWFRQIAD